MILAKDIRTCQTFSIVRGELFRIESSFAANFLTFTFYSPMLDSSSSGDPSRLLSRRDGRNTSDF